MGEIDKEKLLKEIRSLGYYEETQVIKTIKNFPEEQEIDFDALYEEWEKSPKDVMPYSQSYNNFLRSKNLTIPNPVFDIPVKRTWTLKKEYEKYSRIIGHTPTTLIVDPTVAPDPEFYDYKEEPDYSKIPKGSIVEIEYVSGNMNKCGYVNGITNKSISIGFHMIYNSGNSITINFDQIESIVILKLAKE